MAVLGIDLNDAAITGVVDGELRFCEPGFALAAPGGEDVYGDAARRQARRLPRRVQNRFWRELSESAPPGAEARSPADLAHGQLAALWRSHGTGVERVVLAIPPYWSREQLALMLGITEDLGLPVRGLVDSAVAATRRAYEGRELVHVEGSLHDVTLTRMEQAKRAAAVGERHALTGLGLERLARVCIEHIARRFVQAARFDPLHDAESEQFLHDRLDGWLEPLARGEPVTVTVEFAGHSHSVTLSPEAFEEALGEALQPLVQQIRSWLSVDRDYALQLTPLLAAFPGVVARLDALPGVAVFVLEADAAARGAARRVGGAAGPDDGFRLLTSLPWDQAAVPAGEQPSVASARAPTHVRWRDRVFRLDRRPFSVGTELAPGDYGIAVDGRDSGVSRRHCQIQVENGRVVLRDLSRFGTRLNDHRIEGSAVLQSGDVIGVGGDAVRLQLVTEAGDDGA